MKAEEIYAMWAPDNSPWSAWAKPVLFTEMPVMGGEPSFEEHTFPEINLSLSQSDPVAVIIDLPGYAAVRTGLALAQQGFRPVPLFNGCAAPGMVVDVTAIIRALRAGTAMLEQIRLPGIAAPAFLLDANRQDNSGLVMPGRFDNRWAVVAQDMPSASRLRLAGFKHVLLFAEKVRDDLAHILLRYQEAGLKIEIVAPMDRQPRAIKISRPAWYRHLWYSLMVQAGFRRNSAGGFGAVIPEPNSAGG
jgi:hypothetical protein